MELANENHAFLFATNFDGSFHCKRNF